MDIDAGVDGAETWVFRYGMGRCPGGVSVEFWEMRGSGDAPELSGEFGRMDEVL